MATSHPSQAPSAEVLREVGATNPVEIVNEDALVPSPIPLEQRGALTLTPNLARLLVELDVAVPVRDFRVRNLLTLERGQVIETQWALGDDLPLTATDAQLAWTEFEVVESKLAVRLTRLT